VWVSPLVRSRTTPLVGARQRSVAVRAEDGDAEPEPAAAAAPEAAYEPPRAATGDELYAVCSRCGAAYEADLALYGGKGAKVRCAVCSNVWFQMTERLVPKPEAFELQPFPDDRREARPSSLDSPKPGGSINIYVGNMPFSLTDVDLANMFADYGTVTKIMLMRDEIGRSKGFGFIEMASEEQGRKAIEELNEMPFGGRPITVAARDMRAAVAPVGRRPASGPPRAGGAGGDYRPGGPGGGGGDRQRGPPRERRV
jgi:predicted Zn finger-like uncharacterized protein